jgi:hypothetical protein
LEALCNLVYPETERVIVGRALAAQGAQAAFQCGERF